MDDNEISIVKRGKYIHVLHNNITKLASFSLISFKMWGQTEHFKKLNEAAEEHLKREIESKHIRKYHADLFGKFGNISAAIDKIDRVGDYIHASGNVFLTAEGKTKIIKINDFLYNDEGVLKQVDKKEINNIKKFFE